MAHSPVRRGDDRHARDRRGHARAASRSRERRSDDRTRDRERDRDRDRERDRDSYGRRDRSRDRSYDRPYDNRRRDDRRHERRDRSRDRKRSREASPVRDRRDGRDRDRYRDSRDSYDDRDRKRPRRSPSPKRDDRTRDRDRERDRDGRTPARRSEKDRDVRAPSSLISRKDSLTAQSRPNTANSEAAKQSAEEQAALDERQAKVAEWRAQMLAKKAAKEAASPAVQSPDAAATLPAGPATNGASLKPKLDPKEIQKKVRAAKVKQDEAAKNKPLGGDVAIPTPAPANTSAPSATIPNGRSAVPSKLDTKVKGFGLNKTVGDKNEAAAPKATAGLDDDEDTERKFRKLPEFPSADLDEPEYAYEEDEDTNNINDDEEANREAALRRAEAAKESDVQDVKMVDTAIAAPDAADTDMGVDDDDDVDPLDAFMNDLDAANEALKSTRQPSRVKQEAQVFNSDDEGDLDAMGDRSDDIAAMMKKNKKKDIGAVDHAKMDYLDFRRNFYSESVEIADMDDEEVAELRAELDNITVKGKDVPKPIMKFPQGGFGTQILEVINQLQFEKPSSIQSQALPAIMSGRDTIGVAKTGSGKTMAFLLPMFRHIKDQPPLDALDGPIGMVMAPTRELAVQIHRDSKPFLKALNLRAVCAYGGAPIKDQIAEFKRGAEIVVCTPGRMIDLLAANNGRVTNLRRVSYVVLDEADRMFDMGFEPQITKILSNVRPDRQNILFSATFPPKLETLARKTLKEPVEIQVGGKSVVAAEITQMVEVREADTRFFRLLELLGQLFSDDDDTRCLIFVEKQHTADILFKELIKKGYPSVVIHGAREQIDRDQAILDFKNNVFPVMVATSVAARGLDVKQLKLVVNYDCPNHNEDYVHRCGRTGRAGNKGTAVTFVLPDQDRFANFLAKALTQSEQPVPPEVQKLADQFQEKVKSGAEKQYKRDGFGGKGIEKLDSKRQDARKDEAKRLGKEFRVDDDEDDDEPDDKKKKKDGSSKAEEESDPLPKKYADILRRAMEVQKTETPPPQSNPTPSRPAARAKGDPMAAARAAASAINNRVGGRGTARPGQPIDNHGPDAGAFHATLEINDFPQKARWAVTNRTNTSKILEEANVSITTKGRQYPQGEEPAQGDLPKLYILVEGPTSIIVEDAMADLVKKLREGVLEDLQSSGKPTTGRYKVV